MAEVRMNLKEYDELREELNLYKRTLKELLTTVVDDWDIEHYNENSNRDLYGRGDYLSNLSSESQKLIEDTITQNIPEEISNLLGEIKLEKNSRLVLFTLKHLTEESEEINDEVHV